MRFHLKADAEFEADDITDAMRVIGEYYLALYDHYLSEDEGAEGPKSVFDGGSINIFPCTKQRSRNGR